jgi:hypothetical protein
MLAHMIILKEFSEAHSENILAILRTLTHSFVIGERRAGLPSCSALAVGVRAIELLPAAVIVAGVVAAAWLTPT